MSSGTNFYRHSKRHKVERKIEVEDDDINKTKSEFVEGGNESDSSLESVDLNHNASETEMNSKQSLEHDDFLQSAIKDDESDSKSQMELEKCDSKTSLVEVQVNKPIEPARVCLMSKRTSLPATLHGEISLNPLILPQTPERHCQSVDEPDRSNSHRSSVFDDLLFEIYNRFHYGYKDSLDSDTFTDMTESDVVLCRTEQGRTDGEKVRLNVANLTGRDIYQLRELVANLSHHSTQTSSRLVKQLKARERHLTSLREKYDIMTAILHASSLKRREDSKIRFSIEPMPGDDAFNQWKDAMKAVARLPHGIPQEFRKKVWLALADNYLSNLCINWEKTKKFTFNEKSNPDDNKLGLQIVKDLHRTGCSGFSGRDNEEDRAVLKRVLLAFARWNKHVGYCQGFNILAALILEVVDRQEDSALKVMIYLIDRVLPESYFANNLRSLSVDMAVFRHLLRSHLPELSRHLDSLQNVARDEAIGANYEPPLTNVFTMQWFLTMFATCLSKSTVLRVWDCILLEGSEILLRTAIVIWEKLQHRIMEIKSADEFYSVMGILSQEMLDDKLLDTEDLIKRIFNVASFPLHQLNELREKFTYNISPFSSMMNANRATTVASSKLPPEDDDDDDLMDGMHCFSSLFSGQHSMPNKSKDDGDHWSADVSKLSPGAYTAHPVCPPLGGAPVLSERVTLDVDMLKRQYKKLMQKQRQAHVILSAVQNKKISNNPLKSQNTLLKGFSNEHSIAPAINHLFASRELLLMTTMNRKNQTVLPVTKTLQSTVSENTTRAPDAGDLVKKGYLSPVFSRLSSVESSFKKASSCEFASSVASVSSISVGHDEQSVRSEATCEPSQPWTESTPRETPIPPSENTSVHLKPEDGLQDEMANGEIAFDEDNLRVDEQPDAEMKENEDTICKEEKDKEALKNEKRNISFKEFIDSLPDDSNPNIKSTRYNKLQCFVENFRPIRHSPQISGGLQPDRCRGKGTYGRSLSFSDDKPLQMFNPFPRKNVNLRKSKLGIQLGLYMSQNCN